MNAVVEEWIRKADGDFRTANRELTAEVPNFDAACFHAQQCIEKLFKAMLIDHDVMPPRTHDLPALDALLRTVAPSWTWPLDQLRLLSHAAVAFRYPGETAEKSEAEASVKICTAIRTRLLLLLGSGV